MNAHSNWITVHINWSNAGISSIHTRNNWFHMIVNRINAHINGFDVPINLSNSRNNLFYAQIKSIDAHIHSINTCINAAKNSMSAIILDWKYQWIFEEILNSVVVHIKRRCMLIWRFMHLKDRSLCPTTRLEPVTQGSNRCDH